jgi:hypothetical protein
VADVPPKILNTASPLSDVHLVVNQFGAVQAAYAEPEDARRHAAAVGGSTQTETVLSAVPDFVRGFEEM